MDLACKRRSIAWSDRFAHLGSARGCRLETDDPKLSLRHASFVPHSGIGCRRRYARSPRSGWIKRSHRALPRRSDGPKPLLGPNRLDLSCHHVDQLVAIYRSRGGGTRSCRLGLARPLQRSGWRLRCRCAPDPCLQTPLGRRRRRGSLA